MSVNGSLIILPSLEHTSSLDLSTPTETFGNIIYNITSGTGDDKMDLMWHDQRTLAGSTSESLDLSGSLVDAFGSTMAFSEVRMILIQADIDNGNMIAVGGAASNAFVNWVGNSSDIVNVAPRGVFLLYAPLDGDYSVTAGTGDILKIENLDASSAVYDIYVGGTSA